jgi:hypothetical protein
MHKHQVILKSLEHQTTVSKMMNLNVVGVKIQNPPIEKVRHRQRSEAEAKSHWSANR